MLCIHKPKFTTAHKIETFVSTNNENEYTSGDFKKLNLIRFKIYSTILLRVSM